MHGIDFTPKYSCHAFCPLLIMFVNIGWSGCPLASDSELVLGQLFNWQKIWIFQEIIRCVEIT